MSSSHLWIVSLALGLCACAASTRPSKPAAIRAVEKRPWTLEPPIGIGLPDDAVVHVVNNGIGCSGTLITERLVLTAHHCVVWRDADGEMIERDVAPSALSVELGGDYLPWGAVGVKAVVAPPCGYKGGHGDIAVLVIERQLRGTTTMTARLDRPPTLGEVIDPVGFGRCPLSGDGVHRIRRNGGPVDQVVPGSVYARTSICPGDSGGPARSAATGEVVGVISASAMDDSDETRDPSTYTRIDVWRSLFENAQLVADGATLAEVPPVVGCEKE